MGTSCKSGLKLTAAATGHQKIPASRIPVRTEERVLMGNAPVLMDLKETTVKQRIPASRIPVRTEEHVLMGNAPVLMDLKERTVQRRLFIPAPAVDLVNHV